MNEYVLVVLFDGEWIKVNYWDNGTFSLPFKYEEYELSEYRHEFIPFDEYYN